MTEAVLFAAGATTRLGRVEDGTTTTDFDEDEIRRKISISTALAWTEWKGHKLNLVDTPGFAAFLADARNALRVVDGAVVVVGAVDGVKVQTEKVWSTAAGVELPRAVYISKMDRERADFARAVEDIRKNLSASAVPVQVPIGQEAGFSGVVDLVRMRALRFTPDGTGKPTEEDVPADVRESAERERAALVEAVAEADDRLLEKYLESGELSESEVREGLVQAIRDRKLFPILCGAPARNVGVTPLLDLVVEAFPSPLDRPPVEGKDAKGNPVRCEAKDGAPLTALVFKTIADPFAGKVTMFRIYAGTMTSDSSVLNVSKGAKERIGQLLLLRGKQQTPVEALGAGDIGAVVKLKETGTGDTLCDEKAPVRLPEISFPAPVISFAVEPKAKGDEDKMSIRLHPPARGGPHHPDPLRSANQGDGGLRHGARPRRDRGGAAQAEIRRGRHTEDAAGAVQGDDQGAGARGAGAAQEADRRSRPVRGLLDPHGAPAAWRRLRVLQPGRGRRHPPELHPGRGEGGRGGHGAGRRRRLSRWWISR